MLFIAHTAEDLQALLYQINILAIKIGLKFNPNKCTTLYYSSKPPAGCRDTIFNLAGSELSHMYNGNPTMFLGKPIGAFLPRDSVTLDRLKQRGMKILSSMLTPWQRIDCIKIFFYPPMLFLEKTDQLSKTDWSLIEDALKPLLKKTLGLPSNATNEYLHGSREDGHFGTPLAAEDGDIALINGGFKLLTSNDNIIQKLAWGELVDAAKWRYESTSYLKIS